MSKWFESYHHACGFLSFLRRNGEAARPCGIDDDLIPNSDLGVQSFIETVRISRKAGRASLLGGLHQQFTPDPINEYLSPVCSVIVIAFEMVARPSSTRPALAN